MVTAIISIMAAILLALYVSELRAGKPLQTQEDGDLRPLTKELLMEAIRFNGFMPEDEGRWISFMCQGERFIIDTDRLPIMVMMKHYDLDHKEWDMDLMHKAAHQVSDDLIMSKVLFTGKQEDGIAFQITAIENKYGHFKDCLTRYISIIKTSQTRMNEIYHDLETEQTSALSLFPQLEAGASGEKKVVS